MSRVTSGCSLTRISPLFSDAPRHFSPSSSPGQAGFWLCPPPPHLHPSTALMCRFSGGAGGEGGGGVICGENCFSFFSPPYSSARRPASQSSPHCWRASLQLSLRQDGIGAGERGSGAIWIGPMLPLSLFSDISRQLFHKTRPRMACILFFFSFFLSAQCSRLLFRGHLVAGREIKSSLGINTFFPLLLFCLLYQ